MKTYELSPTHENLQRTYLKDSLARNKNIFHFIRLLNSIEGSYAIALNGKWGSGKTFFVKQTKMVLEANNDFNQSISGEEKEKIKEIQSQFLDKDELINSHVCIYYDAWENDNDDDPVLSLVYAIMQTVSTEFSFVERDYLKAGTALLEGVVKSTLENTTNMLKAGLSVLEHLSGTNWEEIIKGLKGEDPLESLKKSKSLQLKVNDFLNSILPEKGNRLIVFIDELDRCSPEYAVRLLERIKHYFCNENVTFVFSINLSELQHTVKKYYGNSFDGYRYLDRFFNLTVELPPAELDRYYSEIGFDSSNQVWAIVSDALVKKYHMELREISHYFQLCKLTIGNYLDGLEISRRQFIREEQYYIFAYIAPIMIALKSMSLEKYEDFISGIDGSPLIEVSDCLSIGFFSYLLENSETFSKNDRVLSTAKSVCLKDKLEMLYEALFKTEYNRETRYRIIGKVQVGEESKALLTQISSTLSKYAMWDDQ